MHLQRKHSAFVDSSIRVEEIDENHGKGLFFTPTSLGTAIIKVPIIKKLWQMSSYSFDTYLFSIYDVPGIFLDTGYIAGKKIKFYSQCT